MDPRNLSFGGLFVRRVLCPAGSTKDCEMNSHFRKISQVLIAVVVIMAIIRDSATTKCEISALIRSQQKYETNALL